jgi:peptidoglycan/LPS O-acetylase OafA/YrhL
MAAGMNAQSLPPARARLEFLDALRGLAAVYVLVYHMLLLPQPNLLAPRWAEKVALNGGTGVTMFFIVSAFSLYYTMPLRLRERSPTFNFYLHRFFRIAPLFYFLIAATLVRDAWAFGVRHSLLEIGASMAFLFNLIPTRQEGFVWVSWTIGVEMLFYAVFPLLYARVKTLGASIALFFAALMLWQVVGLLLDYSVMPEAWKQSILHWNVLRHFPIFAVGIVIYHVFVSLPHAHAPSESATGTGNALVWAGVFGYAALLQGWLPNVFGDSYYWQGLVFACMFMGLALSPWRLVVNRATRFLGKISYSVYLVHTTVIFFLAPVYHWIYRHAPSLTACFLGSLALTLLLVLPLSWLTYRFVEEPGIRLGKRISRRLADRAAQARASVGPG